MCQVCPDFVRVEGPHRLLPDYVARPLWAQGFHRGFESGVAGSIVAIVGKAVSELLEVVAKRGVLGLAVHDDRRAAFGHWLVHQSHGSAMRTSDLGARGLRSSR